jgi:hypothetical protein
LSIWQPFFMVQLVEEAKMVEEVEGVEEAK